MDKTLWFLLAFLAAVCLSQRRSDLGRCPRPTGVGVCASNCRPGFYDRCRRSGRICCRNACGAYRCTRPREPPDLGIPPWCPPGSPRIRCFVNPCTVMRCPRFPRARCRPTNPCEPSCTGAFFLRGRRIPDRLCNFRGRRRN